MTIWLKKDNKKYSNNWIYDDPNVIYDSPNYTYDSHSTLVGIVWNKITNLIHTIWT